MNTDTIRNLVVHMRNSVTNLGVMPEYYRDNLNNICTLLEREVGLQPAVAGLVIGALFILPYLLLSATSGQLTDKFEKTKKKIIGLC